MIEIIYRKDYNKFRASGHARSDEIGKDLVCAGVTTLVYTLASALGGLYQNGALRERAAIRMESGEAEMNWLPKANMQSNVALAVGTVMGGFQILADQYPEYVKFEVLG